MGWGEGSPPVAFLQHLLPERWARPEAQNCTCPTSTPATFTFQSSIDVPFIIMAGCLPASSHILHLYPAMYPGGVTGFWTAVKGGFWKHAPLTTQHEEQWPAAPFCLDLWRPLEVPVSTHATELRVGADAFTLPLFLRLPLKW